MRNNVIQVLVFLALVLVGNSGCTGGGTPGVTERDACKVLSKADAEKVLGGPVGEPNKNSFGDVSGSGAGMTQCSYTAIDSASFASASLMIRKAAPSEKAEGAYERFASTLNKQMGDDYELKPVEGLGGPAGWNAGAKQLTTFVGADLVIVSVHKGQDDTSKAARELTELLLPRLRG